MGRGWLSLGWHVSAARTRAQNQVPQDNVLEVLATMAAICHNAVNDPERAARFRNPGTVTYCLRVMVSVITLYDHVNPLGAFHKNSPINVRAAPRPGKGGGGAVLAMASSARVRPTHPGARALRPRADRCRAARSVLR